MERGDDRSADAVDGVAEPVPLEVLERRLTSRAAELAAAESEWMGWLVEYDRRRGWQEWGCSSVAHWLSWKCGFSPSAGRERARVATALAELPLVRTEFAAGRLSYCKVQAVTRVANRHNEADLVDMARNASGAQLTKIVAGYRSSATTDHAAQAAFLGRRWTTRRNHDGTTTLTLVVPDADASQIRRHVERVASGLIDDAAVADAITRRELIAERGGVAAVRADAAIGLLTGEAGRVEPTPADVAMIVTEAQADHQCSEHCVPDVIEPTDTCAQARSSIASEASASQLIYDEAVAVRPPTDDQRPSVAEPTDTCAQARRNGSDPHEFEVLVDGEAVAESVGRRLLCDPRVQALVESADGGPLAVGRSTRIIGRRLRRALERRDHGCCRFPGCHVTQRLHAHHIVHWADGGATDLDNLILLCHFHHHLVHEGGWSVEPGSRRFIRPDGAPVDPTAAHLRAGAQRVEPNDWLGSDAGPLEPHYLSPLDLPWTTTILHHNEAVRRREAGLP
ncbi:MAG: DUF222 domain-containing protein [Actinomycetota bacterium]